MILLQHEWGFEFWREEQIHRTRSQPSSVSGHADRIAFLSGLRFGFSGICGGQAALGVWLRGRRLSQSGRLPSVLGSPRLQASPQTRRPGRAASAAELRFLFLRWCLKFLLNEDKFSKQILWCHFLVSKLFMAQRRTMELVLAKHTKKRHKSQWIDRRSQYLNDQCI